MRPGAALRRKAEGLLIELGPAILEISPAGGVSVGEGFAHPVSRYTTITSLLYQGYIKGRETLSPLNKEYLLKCKRAFVTGATGFIGSGSCRHVLTQPAVMCWGLSRFGIVLSQP